MRMAYKPDFVPGLAALRWPFVWACCYQQARAANPDLWGEDPCLAACDPYLALLLTGFTVPSLLPRTRWSLTPPFHPYPRERRRSILCGTFPRVAPAGR